MATVGKKKQDEEVTEKEVDFMADAPPERPYHEAVTDEHRQILAEAGIPVIDPGKDAEPA